MSGPLDESRHTAIHIGEDGIHVHTPKPYSELTEEERRRVDDLAAIERWQDHLYAERARRRQTRNKGEKQ